MTPATGSTFCPVVGIGASAGGLQALSQFLSALPVDTGMAFVVVQHLAANHESILASILARVTSMPVTEVVPDGTSQADVAPNHVYVIPPGQSMTLSESKLNLFEREQFGQPRVIDRFFTSLAQERGHMAVGVILSGTASDGTLGVEEIKAAGGITFAQDSSAQFPGMPRSAIEAGSIDYELAPAEIAREIARIATYLRDTPAAQKTNGETRPGRTDISSILSVLQKSTGVDFSQYQPNTLVRRIERRMILVKVKGLREYLRLLRDEPSEVKRLYQDVLINVTSFFRDQETFDALESQVIPGLLEAHESGEPVRVWVVGCATGEEVYSLAMLFAEASDIAGDRPNVQLFATDLSATNIDKARAGVYSLERVQTLGPARLERFFTETEGLFRVIKPIREICVFAKHDVVVDPPFSRMDLVSCRNLLIYLQPDLQQRVLKTLHYALNPAGCLMLGSSETVGQTRELFRPIDGTLRLFAKNNGRQDWVPAARPKVRKQKVHADVPAANASSQDASPGPGSLPAGNVQREAERLLLARFAPPAVLVNRELDIVYVRGEVDSYLSLPEGKPSLNLLKTARDGLLMPLRSAIQRAVKEGNPVRSEAIIFKSGKKRREVTIEIVPIKGRAASEGALLVLFEQDSPAAGPVEPPPRDDFPQESLEAQIGRLEQELASTRDYLQSVIEQGEATNEELQSANEEAQSSNEELQSINEELETSKEEIQSSNEELITVNDELQSRNAEVSQVNNDLVNLIGSVEAAIVMVGLNFCIRRFTPMAERLLNIIPSDVGRPITNISMNVVVPDLRALLTTTIETVNSQELEVQDTNGRWYSLRVRPYVTIEKRIEGAVMMLVDIDANKRARDYAESIVETVRQPIVILDEALRIRTANDAFSKLFEVARGDLPGLSLFELGGKPWNAQVLRRLLDSVLPENTTFDDFELSHDFERAGRRTMLFSGRKLTPPGGAAPLVLLAIEDVTERRVNEAAMARDEKAYRVGLESLVSERTHDLNLTVKELEGFCYTVAHDLRTPLRGIIFNSSALIEELGSSVNPDQNRMLRSQVEHAKRLSTLIDDLLEFSRMLNLPVRRQEIDATALVRAVAQELPQAGELVAPELQIQEGMRCEADEPLLRLVFTNLIENAYKFSPRGGNLTVGREMQGEMPVFFVKDEGIGFDMVYSTKVFEPFERLDASEKFAGTGIGLATTKRIVERHGGKIWVTAELGKGAAFYFTLASDIATEPTSRSNETDA